MLARASDASRSAVFKPPLANTTGRLSSPQLGVSTLKFRHHRRTGDVDLNTVSHLRTTPEDRPK